MNTQDNNIIKKSDKLSLIYRTDPFGFPLHAADEEIYQKSIAVPESDTQVIYTEYTPKDASSDKATDTPEPEIINTFANDIS